MRFWEWEEKPEPAGILGHNRRLILEGVTQGDARRQVQSG